MTLSFSNSAFRQGKAGTWYGGLSTGTQPDSAWCCGEIDNLENVYIGSRNVFAKINNTPSVVWQKSLSDTSAIITGLVVDSTYNVYICYVTLLSGSYYVNIEKFNSSGASVWAKQLTSAVNPLTTTATLGSEPNQYPRMSLGSSSTLFLSVHGKAMFKLDTDGNIVWQYSTAIVQSNNTPAVFYTTNTLLTTVTSDIRGNILACDPFTLTKITDNGSTASVAWSKYHKHAIGAQIGLGSFGGNFGPAEYNVNSSTAIADSSNNVLWIVHRHYYDGGYGGVGTTVFTHRFNFNSTGVVQSTYNTSDYGIGAGYKLLAFDSINSFIYVTSFPQSVPYLFNSPYDEGDAEICQLATSTTRRIAANSVNYQATHSSLIIKHSRNFRTGNSIPTTKVYPGGCLKINGNNAVLISPSGNSFFSYPTNAIYKYNLNDINNNILYSSQPGYAIYSNGAIDLGSRQRISYIKVSPLGANVNPDYTISAGGYSANIGITNIGEPIAEVSEGTYVGQSTVVSSASISTTSYTLSTISSLASTSSETLISKVFYYK
jgi:hypothetical protein